MNRPFADPAPRAHTTLRVFRVAGTTAFLGYAFAQIQDSIWKGQTWGVTFKHVFDGLIYGLLTAGTLDGSGRGDSLIGFADQR